MKTKKETSIIQDLLQEEANAVLNVPLDNPYQKVIDLIHTSQRNRGRVVVSGVGKAGDVGRKIVSTFNSTGVSAVFLSPLDAAHGDLGVLHDKDLLFLISNSGKTREVLELITLARRFHPKIKSVSLTGTKGSDLSKATDVTLFTGGPSEICPLGLTPTCSVIAMLAIADILTVLSMKGRKFTVADYHKRHHGGYLGSKAKKLFRKK